MSSFCVRCGSAKPSEGFCGNCGVVNNSPRASNSGLSVAAFVLSLLIPILGLVLGLVSRKQNPEDSLAKAAVIIGLIFTVLGVIGLGMGYYFIAQNELNCIRGNQYCW